MRTTWNIIAFLAIVNLLAILFFGGWLYASGRIDESRLESLRTLFAMPVEAEAALVVAAEQQQAQLSAEQEQEASLLAPPLGSEVKIRRVEDIALREEMMLRRMEQRKALDNKALAEQQRQINDEQLALERRIAEFETMKRDQLQLAQQDTFKTNVKLLEGLPARQAKDLVLQMVGSGRKSEAVDYLRGMRAGSRTGIFAQMKSPEELVLASDLLQSLSVPPISGGVVMETSDASGAEPDFNN